MTRPPVVLLHGWGGSFASTFERNGWPIALEAAGHSLFRIDLPGHAAEGASHDPSSYADLAGSIEESLPGGPIDLVGYSLGAKIALELACREPSRIGKLSLIGVGDNAFAPEPNGQAVAAALCDGPSGDDDGPVGALVNYSRASGADPRAIAAVLRRPPNPVASSGRLAAIRSSVLLVNGKHDTIAQPDGELRRVFDKLRYTLLEDADHFALPADRSVIRTVLAFLHSGGGHASDSQLTSASSR